MGSKFDDCIYWTSLLQLHLIITAHTLNSFLIRNLSLHFFRISDWSLVSSFLPLSTTHSCWSITCPFMTRLRTADRTHTWTVRLLLSACSPKVVVQQHSIPRCQGNILSEAPPSTRSDSGFQASCHNNINVKYYGNKSWNRSYINLRVITTNYSVIMHDHILFCTTSFDVG
jgi:hypothetical protein